MADPRSARDPPATLSTKLEPPTRKKTSYAIKKKKLLQQPLFYLFETNTVTYTHTVTTAKKSSRLDNRPKEQWKDDFNYKT